MMFDLNDSAIFTKYIAAGSPYTPEIVLARLSVEPHPQLRCRVAENPRTAPEILDQLSRDPHPDVRLAIGDNPFCTPDMLERLSQDECSDIRLALAENPQLPNHLLHNLLHDENPYVAARALRTLDRKYPSAASRKLTIQTDKDSMDKAV